MSEYQAQFGYSHQTDQEQFMKINDYNEHRQDINNQQQVDDSPFDQLEKIMNQEQNQSSRNEIILSQRVNQLENKCERLFKTNSFLTKRIEQIDLEQKQQAQKQIDLAQLELNFDEIQTQLDSYKKDWEQFRNRQNSSQDKRISQIQQLVKTIQQQKQQISLLQQEKTELTDTNASLQRANRNLEQEIQGLERQLNQERSSRQLSQERSIRQQSKIRSFSRHTTSAFEDQVQAQLQQLIQKLMAELQFERSSHKKSMMEIKRMQQEILQLQREIVGKNNKIYQIEMQNLKGQKIQSKNTNLKTMQNNSKSDRLKYQNSQAYKTKSDRNNNNSVLKSFTIEQLLSGAIDINEKERYIVASKVIQFYLKKVETNDLVPYNTDKIMVTNYNKVNPSLIMIRKLPITPFNGELSLSSLGWNLGVILSGLLIQWKEDVQVQDQDEEFIGVTIQRLLRQKLSEVEELYSLKSVVDQIIKRF